MKNFITAALLIMFASFSRLLPHPENFAPVAAVAIFAGLYLNKKYALIIPIAAVFLSDIFIGLYPYVLWVYGTYILIALMNIGFRSRYNNLKGLKKGAALYGATIVSSIVFFIVTNFGVWVSGLYYEMNLQGLINSYIAALPFFRTSLLADTVYVTIMAGVFGLVIKLTSQPSLLENRIRK